jgi:photosystem II stability/assembly factor-like uncharacterized protein
MSRLPLPALPLLAAVLAAPPAATVDVAPRWQAGGPEGWAQSFEFARSDPSRVYATTGGGVFVSTDTGFTWRATGVAGLDSLELAALAVDPLDPDRVYLGLSYSGAFRSDDGGRTWHAARQGLEGRYPWQHPFESVSELAASRAAPGTVFAMANEFGGSGRLYISRDRGAHWDPAVGVESIDFVAIAPWAPEVVYVGGQGRVQRSEDGGLTWETVAGLASAGVEVMAFGPPGSGAILAAGWALHRSTDGGETWSPPTGGMGDPRGLELAADAGDPLRLYAGCWGATLRSSDGGQTWSRLADPAGSTCTAGRHVVASPAPGGPVLTDSCDASVLRLEGDGWVVGGSGLQGVPIGLVVVNPERPAVAYAAAAAWHPFAPRGLYRTTDGGQAWELITRDLGPYDAYGVAMDPGNPRRLLLTMAVEEGLLASTDGGDTWSAVDLPGAEPFTLRSCVFAPSNHLRAYGFRLADSSPWTATEVLRSEDGGSTWETHSLVDVLPPEPQATAVDPRQPDTLYAGMSSYGGGVSKSTDGGATWVDSIAGLPWLECWTGPCPDTVVFLTIHPARPERVWAATWSSGLYVSDDAGGSWYRCTAPVRARAVGLVAAEPDTVIVGDVEDGRGLISEDGGTPWRPLGAAVDAAPGVLALAASPSGDLVYAGTTASLLHLQQPATRRPEGRERPRLPGTAGEVRTGR